ncbi:Protein downstream neighbor of Son like [Actinidia chinensis var. chinensis]|uniref:Protein downstream neighbor of Son like n=1 Tax=Actinidia chinensis var. chinensis TaxID=1590841 RepID=A0A2R6QVP9_ACTCC|nr:Protein downstream neighbor of Son like [Actinidia chinensis var. chinensis]
MAKVAAQCPVTSNALHFGGGPSKVGTAVKRKTPSELRGEQLKRKNVVELVDESPALEPGSLKNTTGVIWGLKKPNISKTPRYIDTRMDEVYPVRKSSIKLRMLSKKENGKQEISPAEHTGNLKSTVSSDSAAESQPRLPCAEDSFASTTITRNGMARECEATDGMLQDRKATEKCSENMFCSVTDLSSGGEKLSGLETVDLDRALKGLIAHEPPSSSSLASNSSERIGDFTLGNFSSEFHIPGQKTPLDFTLKTTMWVVSSSSVNWFHRLITCATSRAVAQFACSSQLGCLGNRKTSCLSELSSTTPVINNVRALHSWVYPQSSLPPSVISALTLSSAEGVQMDFLDKRQLSWEEAFRSLYYMLRKSVCDIFYVCTAQFVVMFIGHDGLKESKRTFNAYISQSTRSLRSLLREQDIHFSMPLCHSKVEQVTTEDLVELSEMEKHNLGQIRRLGSVSDVDNSPQSLLVFSGHQNVHGLYDFLLNYRFFLTSLTSVDVPVLYSPVPFQNGALSSPEVRCKEARKADNISFPQKEFNMKDEPHQGSPAGFCYSIEIKDAYLPPWVICSLCEAMGSQGMSFEASFITESTSTGLNAGLETICQNLNPQPAPVEGLQESSSAFGIPNTITSPKLCSAFLKGLKYSNGSYTASLSSV